jgi:hypothetical protein
MGEKCIQIKTRIVEDGKNGDVSPCDYDVLSLGFISTHFYYVLSGQLDATATLPPGEGVPCRLGRDPQPI